MSQTLPKQFSLGTLPVSAKLRQYQARVSSMNQVYTNSSTSGQTIQIVLPASPGTWIDARSLQLSMRVTNTSTTSAGGTNYTAARLVGSANTFISQLRIFAGQSSGQLLEDSGIYYAELFSALADLSLDPNQWLYDMSVTQGTDTGTVRNGTFFAANGTSTYQKTFQIPLISFLSTLTDSKAIPLHAGYTLFITLNSANNCFIPGGATTDLVSASFDQIRVEYSALELPPELDASIFASGHGQVVIPAVRWQSYSATLAASSSSFSVLIGAALASMKSMLWRYRYTGDVNVCGASSLYFPNLGFTDQYLTLGGVIVPQTKLDSDSLCWTSARRARHLLNSPPSGLVNYTTYTTSAKQTATANTVSYAAHICGLDFDAVSTNAEQIVSGVSTNGQLLQLQIDTSSTLANQAQVLVFTEANAYYTFDGRNMSVSY